MFKQGFQLKFGCNKVKYVRITYVRITITHVCIIALTLAGSLGRCLNTWPVNLMPKQLPRDRIMLIHAKKHVWFLYYHFAWQFSVYNKIFINVFSAGPRSAVGNVSGYRCVSDCRSRGREFDPGPVPYFRGDWSWNDFYGHSSPFRWFIQEGLLSVTSESMSTNYWLTACSSLPRKVWLGELTVPQWP